MMYPMRTSNTQIGNTQATREHAAGLRGERINIEAARLNLGLSLKAAGALIGIPDYVLRYAERDGEPRAAGAKQLGGRPRPSAAKKIADFYGVLVTDIWPLDDDRAAA
jgi:hypothetical protein